MTNLDLPEPSRLQQRLAACESQLWKTVTPLSARLKEIGDRLSELLDSRTIRLPYTPHGFDHALEVDALADKILSMSLAGAKLLREPYGLFILTLAVWFHDAGLIQLSDSETVEEIRESHGLRIGRILEMFFSDSLDATEVKLIQDIARNHCEDSPANLPVERIIDRQILPPPQQPTKTAVFPRLSAAILRIADILSITNTRTPWLLYRHMELNRESVKHWQSHLSIESVYFRRTRSRQNEVVVSISYSSLELRQFIVTQVISRVEEEIATCNPILAEGRIRPFHLPVCCDYNEHGIGALKSFGVLPAGLYDLLTGGLYGEQDVFIRELVQNGLDATTRQKALEGDCRPDHIDVTVEHDGSPDDIKVKRIIFRDHGIGMDQGDIDTYLLQIAAKASDNPDLIRAISAAGLDPLLQEWGIGFLSVFAVTTDVVLRTHKEGMRPVKLVFHSREGSSEPDGYTGGVICTVEEDPEPLALTPRGTEITLYFKNGVRIDVLQRLKHYVRFPPTMIRYMDDRTPQGAQDLVCGLPEPSPYAAPLVADFLRGGWVALAGDEYRAGVTLTQSGILVEEHVTDLLHEEGLDLRGDVDCKSRFLKLPASRSQAIRGTESWNQLRRRVLEAIPDCVDARISDGGICINASLPRDLLKVTEAAKALPDPVKGRLLEVFVRHGFFRFDDQSQVKCQVLSRQFTSEDDAVIYLVSRGSTADGSTFLRGHYSASGVGIFMAGTLAHSAKAEILRGQGRKLLPIAPKSWTLGGGGYENERLIEEICKREGIRLSKALLSDQDEMAEYRATSRDDVLRAIWNRADWADLGERVKSICVGHRYLEFVFVLGSGVATVRRLREVWEEDAAMRPLVRLLLTAYCESLRVNPDAVVTAVEDFVRSSLGLTSGTGTKVEEA